MAKHPGTRISNARRAAIAVVVSVVIAAVAVMADLAQIGQFLGVDRAGTPLGESVARPSTTPAGDDSGSMTDAPRVIDGGKPDGCVADARRAHEQPVFTLRGEPLGDLQLMHSLDCSGMWGRLQLTEAQPSEGYDIMLTLIRQSDGRDEPYHDQRVTSAIYTALLQDDGSCFHVTAVIGTPDGVVSTSTPCVR